MLHFPSLLLRPFLLPFGAIVATTACHYSNSDAATEGGPEVTDEQAVRAGLDALTGSGEAPGALAQIRHPRGVSLTLRSGTADLNTGAPMVGADGSFRIGSITKSFTAVLVLELVEDGLVALDAPIEAHLPGVIRGSGEGVEIDGRNITVRHLLQHTSGFPDYLDFFPPTPEQPVPAAEQVALVLAHEPQFTPPGSGWAYSNTGYLVLGMLVERITGKDIASVLQERIIEPLGLTGTYWPPQGERALRGPHAHNYLPRPGGDRVDVTELEPTIAGAAGQLVSTPTDLNRFWQALFDDELIEPGLREQMTSAVSRRADSETGYALGLFRVPLSCGGFYLGHSGDHLGVHAQSGQGDDGRQVTVYITQRESDASSAGVSSVVDTAFCSRR
jgi:D-alanyl-D-alanine carboxypeptidase